DKVSLNGSLNWNRADQTEPFNLTLQSATLPIKRLKQWLPKGTGSLGVFGEGLLNQGTLLVSDLELAKQSVADDDDVDGASHEWQLRRARIEVERGLWRSAAGAEFGLNVFRAVWSQDRLQIEHGQVNYQTVPLFFDGEFLPGGKENTALSLNIHGEVTPQQLLDQHAIAKDVFTLKGAVPFSVRIEGAPEKLRANLLFNLAALSGEIPQRLKITPNAQDQLVMHMTLTPQRLDLDHAQLDWAFLDGHLSGASPWADLDLLQLDALLTISDLALLGAAAPHLKPLNLQGRAELDLSQRGDFTAHPPALTLTLRDVGITGGGHVADLSRINGRIKFGATGLEAKNLRLHLGKSPMTLQVRLDDFSEPNLIIDLVAPKVRADDVIFYSDTAFLYDLKGRMQLNGQRLTFEPVDVRLEGGTQASVRGYVAFDAPVTTELDITSPFVNVGEVIDLWSGDSDDDYADSGSGSGSEQEQHQDARVSIKAHAKSGDLYGMQFQKATGLIVPSPQRLVIHPLNFSVDGGFCTAQVISEFEDSQHTRLRISGHAEEIDALTVYRELLNQENIVRGHLRGDFYLEGLTGADFLPSSYGRFNVEVHDGVLHKFPVLSKVFSLLNVSQLLSFSLPDMDSKGMPFDKLQANFVLDKGTISSSDLMIQSEAMNQAYNGSIDLIDEEIDMTMAIHPLGTVDKIVSRVPLAGWLLTGEDQALLTAYFNIEGPTDKPGVTPAPTGTISDTTFGVLMRTLGLPMKLTENPQILWGGEVDKE
ncbi:MAG: AsmA-like C-terminal domain-containing protein, partial [Desulfuromonadales bacterium]|nr:AsmA-like C-terminal domain-containing protein [Desulfuromonadales bacterium]